MQLEDLEIPTFESLEVLQYRDECLDESGDFFFDTILPIIANAPNLTALDLRGSPIDLSLEMLNACKNGTVRTGFVDENFTAFPEYIQEVPCPQLPSVWHLYLSNGYGHDGTRFEIKSLERIFPNLRHLVIKSHDKRKFTTQIIYNALRYRSYLPSLTHVHLDNIPEDAALEELQRLCKIRRTTLRTYEIPAFDQVDWYSSSAWI